MSKGKKNTGAALSAALFSDRNLVRSRKGVGVALLSATLCSSASLSGVTSTVSANNFNPLSAIGTGLDYLGRFAKGTISTIAPLGMAASPIMQAFFMYKMFAEPKIQQLTPKVNPLKNVGPEVMEQLIRSLLNDNLVGQEEAIEQLINALMNKADNPEEGPHIFYLVGPSGSGKNVITDKIIKPTICGKALKPYVMEASYVDMNSSTSVQDQIFGYKILGSSMNGQVMLSPLISYIRSNPYGLIIFNEFDKRKDKNGKSIIELIEENLRTIMDQGGFYGPDNQWVDCRNLTIVFTSNELDECVKNIDNFKGIDLSKVKDPSGSRTVVKHDSSLFKRSNMHIIILKSLTEQDYYKLAAKTYMNLLYELKEKYGVHLLYSGNFEQVCVGIALEAIKSGNGGRGVKTVVNSLRGKILREIIIPNLPRNGGKIRKNFIVLYDQKSGKFICGKYNIKTGVVSDPRPSFGNIGNGSLSQPAGLPAQSPNIKIAPKKNEVQLNKSRASLPQGSQAQTGEQVKPENKNVSENKEKSKAQGKIHKENKAKAREQKKSKNLVKSNKANPKQGAIEDKLSESKMLKT